MYPNYKYYTLPKRTCHANYIRTIIITVLLKLQNYFWLKILNFFSSTKLSLHTSRFMFTIFRFNFLYDQSVANDLLSLYSTVFEAITYSIEYKTEVTGEQRNTRTFIEFNGVTDRRGRWARYANMGINEGFGIKEDNTERKNLGKGLLLFVLLISLRLFILIQITTSHPSGLHSMNPLYHVEKHEYQRNVKSFTSRVSFSYCLCWYVSSFKYLNTAILFLLL